jgi:hypothetical protein
MKMHSGFAEDKVCKGITCVVAEFGMKNVFFWSWVLVGMYYGKTLCAADDGIPMDAAPDHSWKQTGWANITKKHAKPTNTSEYGGYWVGGAGALKRKSSAPSPIEGTYGRDYFGKNIIRNVVLGWTTPEKVKGGTGKYATDGGPHVPDVFIIRLPEKHEGKE